MDKKLLISGFAKLLYGLAGVCLLLFWPAGTFAWGGAWLLLAILFIPMPIAGIIMWLKNPELLRRRLNMKEREGTQRAVIALALVMFVVGFVVAGLDFRFGWTRMPAWIPIIAAMLFLIGYGLYGEVLRENAYLSRTIEVQAGQRVVSSGLYGVVRHPMYAAAILMFLAVPLVLGSAWALIVFLAYPLLMVKRIWNEEEVLRAGLEGYSEYMQKVRYRLIPFVW